MIYVPFIFLELFRAIFLKRFLELCCRLLKSDSEHEITRLFR